MRITDLLNQNGINLNFEAASKEQAIDKLVDLMASTGSLNDKQGYKEAILAREAQGSTGIGDGIAIPYAKTAAVAKDGVEYNALDGQPSKLFFMIAAPAGGENVHLDVLSRLSTILMDETFINH